MIHKAFYLRETEKMKFIHHSPPQADGASHIIRDSYFEKFILSFVMNYYHTY